LHEINYLSQILDDAKIGVEEKIAFASLTIESLSQINETIYVSILPFTKKTND
jgi:hypothetical protein